MNTSVIKRILELAEMSNRSRMMQTGVDNSQTLFWFIRGMNEAASPNEQEAIGTFTDYLYDKYGKFGGHGWYKSLDEKTGDTFKSVDLFFEEAKSYFALH